MEMAFDLYMVLEAAWNVSNAATSCHEVLTSKEHFDARATMKGMEHFKM